MHRSGTSALASVLGALGLDPGSADGLMRPDVGNPDGYFEVESVAALDERILRDYGGRWDIPPLLAPGWATEVGARELVAELRATFEATFANHRFVLKDPRMSLLLPLWRQALLDRVAVVVVVRDPAEVAWSLALRDGMAPLTGLGLWAAYNRTLLADLEGLPVHFCSYRDLVERPRDVVGTVAASLAAWGELDDQDLDAAVARVRPSLRRDTHPATDPILAEPPSSVRELAAALAALDGRHDHFTTTVPSPGWWEGPLLDERRVFVQHYERALGERDRRIDELVNDNEAVRRQSEELRAELVAAHESIVEYQDVVRVLESSRAVRISRAIGRGSTT